MIIIDINKAKEVWKNKIRIARTSALEKLDVDFIRATEESLDTSTIVANKQLLRDLPNQVDTANSINEIKAVWNNLLK
jgi:phosphotransferase system IIA component